MWPILFKRRREKTRIVGTSVCCELTGIHSQVIVTHRANNIHAGTEYIYPVNPRVLGNKQA